MIDRETRLPLVIGALFALLMHAVLVPVWAVGLSQAVGRRPTVPPKQDKPLPTPRELEAGRAHASVTNLAWIAYDDYRELLAKHSIVEQPAIQKQQEPTPGAPIQMDPTPPAPNAQPRDKPVPPNADAGGGESLSLPVSASSPVPLPTPGDRGQMPYAPQGPTPREAAAVVPDAPDTVDRASESPTERRADQHGSPAQPSRPTAAPRDQAEAPPVTIVPGLVRVRPGAVLTADGIEIKTVVPRPSIIARYSAVPRNPKATIWFNPQGEVTHVELTRSTGAQNWDDPIITALEHWTAQGERIDNLEGELRFKVEILLTSE